MPFYDYSLKTIGFNDDTSSVFSDQERFLANKFELPACIANFFAIDQDNSPSTGSAVLKPKQFNITILGNITKLRKI